MQIHAETENGGKLRRILHRYPLNKMKPPIFSKLWLG